MKKDATEHDIRHVVERVQELGLTAIPLPGEERTAIGTFGVAAQDHADSVEALPGVERVILVSRPFKLASREVQPADSIVRVGHVPIGGAEVAVMAGPCSVETLEQTLATARAVRDAGAVILRGGAYKPSTSPYHFRGLGERGLEILAQAKRDSGLPVVTEVLTPSDVDRVALVADCLQTGARNMQNFALLDAVGETQAPVLLKRGLAAAVGRSVLAPQPIA